MVQPLAEAGWQVHALDTLFSSWSHFRSIRLVHLNWFENVTDSSYTNALYSFIKKMLLLLVLRFTGKKLVWTMHNRMTHERRTGFFSRALTRRLFSQADAIVIHSEQSRALLAARGVQSKVHYIPHPDFINVYGPRVGQPPSGPRLSLLFLGVIKPYKNIELLIQAAGHFPDAVSLTLAGKAYSDAYKRQIEKLAASASNVSLKAEFIPDHQLPVLIGQCDLLVLPYDLQSSLNSGTVLLGFSYGKTVICPRIGTLADMTAMQENFYTYHYNSSEEHSQKLIEMMGRAVEMKKQNARSFEKMGEAMLDYVRTMHSKQKATAALQNIYRMLLQTENK